MQNPFSKLLDFKKLALFQEQSKSVLGIDIGSSSIKLVQVRKIAAEPYSKPTVRSRSVPTLGWRSARPNLPVDKIGEALTDVFRESNVTTKRAAISIPLRSSFLTDRYPGDRRERGQPDGAHRSQKICADTISEVSLDWWIVPKPDTEGPVDAAQSAAASLTASKSFWSPSQFCARAVQRDRRQTRAADGRV